MKTLTIAFKRAGSSGTDTLTLEPPAGCPEGLAAFFVWLGPAAGAEPGTILFRASQLDAISKPQSHHIVLNGSIQVGDSIEVGVGQRLPSDEVC
jgi:hypothetical protein